MDSQYKQKPPAGTTRCLVCGGWGIVPRYHRDMADRKECPQCRGDGFVSAVTAVTAVTVPVAPVMDKECDCCEGVGFVTIYPLGDHGGSERKRCTRCLGSGFVVGKYSTAPVRAIPDPFACLRDESEAAE